MSKAVDPEKTWPSLPTDEAAAAFVETADLSGYDWSQAQPVTMEDRRKDGQSSDLAEGMPAEKF
jgi:hypothetical protein